MKRFFATSATNYAAAIRAAAVAAGLAVSGLAFAQQGPTQQERGPIQRGAPARREGYSGPVQTPTMKEWRPSVVPYPVYPYNPYWPGYGYPDYGYYPYPYSYGPYVLPPLYLPGETMYGPETVKRFIGADRVSPPAAGGTKAAPEPKAREDRPPSQRGTGRDSLVRAGRFIGYGDNHFANQKYLDALQRYRSAVEAAPQLAEAYVRQAYALIATGRYEPAVKAIKRGLDLDSGWAKSDFRNDELYGPNQAAKRAHLDALAKAANEKPEDPDLLLLVGLFLYFDGQTERAEPFFQRADQLGSPHAKPFLEEMEKTKGGKKDAG
jgi:tetratricopeptide (TPR) repeat protein